MAFGNGPKPAMEEQSENDALEILGEYGWKYLHGSSIAPGTGERQNWGDLVIPRRLHADLERRYPDLPVQVIEAAVITITTPTSQDVLTESLRVHKLLTRGIDVEHSQENGDRRTVTLHPLDLANPQSNDFLVANQVRLDYKQNSRRFDIVAYVNGLPLAIIELKRSASRETSAERAYNQLRSYQRELGVVGFAFPRVVVASDVTTGLIGTPFTEWEHMAPWRADEEGRRLPTDSEGLWPLLEGVFQQDRFLDLITNFISFSSDESGAVDTARLAKAHQYFAVNKAVDRTLEAIATHGKAGVVWHTQGSGKSKEMEFYTAKIVAHQRLANPTIVVLTDRIDLDNQLYETFAASELLPGGLEQVTSRIALRETLKRPSGGIIFSTLNKFGLTEEERKARQRHPQLSDRRNIVVIVDEAHRSHYDFIDGFARHLHDALPGATFIAFTGTPVKGEKDTEAVFGEVIDTYDLTDAVDDGATVRVFYENRHTPLDLNAGIDRAELDDTAEEILETLDDEDERRRIRSSIARMSELVGSDERLDKLATDIVEHWEARRTEMRQLIGVPGKALIVGYTREICARLYDKIVALRPGWRGADDNNDSDGIVKVVYSGEISEAPHIAKHVRNKKRTKHIQRRAVDPDDKLELVIVNNMWLTGFDSPPLHTLYLDRPLRDAPLMQALARVNRRFGEKNAGLLVDYIGIADDLTLALEKYTDQDRKRQPVGRQTEEAVQIVLEALDILRNVLSGYDYRAVLASKRFDKAHHAYDAAVAGTIGFLKTPPEAPEDGKATPEQRFLKHVRILARAYALCPREKQISAHRDDIEFFEAVRLQLMKLYVEERHELGLASTKDVAEALRKLTANAVTAGGVIDIYAEAGLPKPELSHLNEEFLDKIRAKRSEANESLAIDLLRRAIQRQMRARKGGSVVAQQAFTDKLRAAMNAYTNRALSSAEVMQQLVDLADEINREAQRGKELGLSEDELAFYDAVAANASAKEQMGDAKLAQIAQELVAAIRKDATVDWSRRESLKAKIRAKIKRLLRRYGYPPDASPEAIRKVLEQAEKSAEDWA